VLPDARTDSAGTFHYAGYLARSSQEINGLTEREILPRLDGGLLAKEGLPLFSRLDEVVTDASVETLRRLIPASPDRRIRVASVLALKRLGSEAAVDPLIESLESPDPITVAFAARALVAMGARRAVPALVSRLEHDDEANGSARNSLTWALFQLPHPSAIPVLAVTLRDSRWGPRRIAAHALVAIGTTEARIALESAARELSWWRGLFARHALRHMPPR
jgi:HEAT repeat protein